MKMTICCKEKANARFGIIRKRSENKIAKTIMLLDKSTAETLKAILIGIPQKEYCRTGDKSNSPIKRSIVFLSMSVTFQMNQYVGLIQECTNVL